MGRRHLRRSGFVVMCASVLLGAPGQAQVPPPSAGFKSVAPAPLDAPSSPPRAQVLDVGSVVTGTLADGDILWPEQRFVDAWELVGRSGTTVTVDLLSDSFDAVLYLVGGFQLSWDDDGAGACDARLAISFPSDGTYTLLVSSYSSPAAGDYTLRVTNRPAPPADVDCRAGPERPPSSTCLAISRMEWLAIAAEPGGGPLYPALQARERTACELGLEAQSGERWSSGQTARFQDTWYYPNGQTALFQDTWYYPNGQTALSQDTWYYPNGQTAYFMNSWYLPSGAPSTSAGVVTYALERLPPGRGEELLALQQAGTDAWATLFLIVMASEASR